MDDTTGFEPVTFSKSHFTGRLFCTLCHYTTAHTPAHLAELHHSLRIYKGRGTYVPLKPLCAGRGTYVPLKPHYTVLCPDSLVFWCGTLGKKK